MYIYTSPQSTQRCTRCTCTQTSPNPHTHALLTRTQTQSINHAHMHVRTHTHTHTHTHTQTHTHTPQHAPTHPWSDLLCQWWSLRDRPRNNSRQGHPHRLPSGRGGGGEVASPTNRRRRWTLWLRSDRRWRHGGRGIFATIRAWAGFGVGHWGAEGNGGAGGKGEGYVDVAGCGGGRSVQVVGVLIFTGGG